MQQKKRLVFERNALYEEVWSEPMTRVAAKYGISNNGLKKICLKMSIPIPSVDYWRKKKAGIEVSRVPLPETSERTRYVTSKLRTTYDFSEIVKPEFESETFRDNLKSLIAAEQARPIKDTHEVIRDHKHRYDEWVSTNWSVELFRRDPERRLRPGEPELWALISSKTLPRAYRFLDVLFRVIEKNGGYVIGMCTIGLYGAKISFVFEEMKTRATFKEAKVMNLISEKQYRGRDFDPDRIVYCPNGRLLFKIPDWFICMDSSKTLLEDRIDEIMLALIKEALRKKKK